MMNRIERIAKRIIKARFPDWPTMPDKDKQEQLEQQWQFAKNELERKTTEQGKQHYWIPDKSLMVNITLIGSLNVWEFTCLPLFPASNTYKGGKLNIIPSWRSTDYHFPSYKWGNKDAVQKIIGFMKNADSIQNRVEKQLDWVESKCSITIDNQTRNEIKKYCLKLARSRITMVGKNTKPKQFELKG